MAQEQGEGLWWSAKARRVPPGDELVKVLPCTNCPKIQCLGPKVRHQEAWKLENASGSLAWVLQAHRSSWWKAVAARGRALPMWQSPQVGHLALQPSGPLLNSLPPGIH